MKKILKYIVIFFIVMLLLLSFLVATAKIPKEMISENIKKSERCFRTHSEIDRVKINRPYTFLHIYADAVLLNIAYYFNDEQPLTSVIEAKYYLEYDKKEKLGLFDYDFERLVECEQEPNRQYLRYWHGSAGILRILLIFMDLGQIYIFNAIALIILLTILIILLIRKKAISLIISLIVSLIMIYCIVIPFCLEYTWTFFIMVITSIFATMWKDKSEKLNVLFFITGMLTCFFDFLSTEIITVAVPILIVLVLQAKEKKITTKKEALMLMIKLFFLWGIAYVAMWFAKWIIASIVLKTNAFKYVKTYAKRRINGKVRGVKDNKLWWEAIKRNVLALYPLNLQKNVSKLIIIPISIAVLEMVLIKKRKHKELWLSGTIILIGLLPYIRYIVLRNHSYNHYFFTFRSQIITIMAIILAIIYSIDIEYWKEKIRNRRRNNGTNNINSSIKRRKNHKKLHKKSTEISSE